MTASIGVDGSTFNGWTQSPPTESFPVREEPPLKQGATSPYVSGVPSPPHFPTNGSNNASMTGKFGPSPSRAVHAGLWERNMFHTYFERRRFTRSTSASVQISDGVCTLMSPMNVVSSLVMTSILRSVHVGWDVMRSRRNNAPIRRSVASSFSSSRAAPRSVNVCLARIAPPGMRVGAARGGVRVGSESTLVVAWTRAGWDIGHAAVLIRIPDLGLLRVRPAADLHRARERKWALDRFWLLPKVWVIQYFEYREYNRVFSWRALE